MIVRLLLIRLGNAIFIEFFRDDEIPTGLLRPFEMDQVHGFQGLDMAFHSSGGNAGHLDNLRNPSTRVMLDALQDAIRVTRSRPP